MNLKVRASSINYCEQYTLISLCLLAFCVSLGAATVSVAKVLILVGVFCQLSSDIKDKSIYFTGRINNLYIWMFIAIGWMLISMFWSIGSVKEQWKYLYGNSRFIWLAAVFYLLRTKERSLIVLKWLLFGNVLVVIISWLLWSGLEIPFTKNQQDTGVAFTSRIEQPVMITLALIIIWNFRQYWIDRWGKLTVRILVLIMLANLVFISTGRTGYLVFLVAVGVEIYRKLPINWKWTAWLSPVLFVAILFQVSPTFQDRTLEMKNNTETFLSDTSNQETSEGNRLDMWIHSISAIIKKPIIGYGIGSMPNVYKKEGGLIKGGVSQPHQQYLFWWVELGLVGLIIMLWFFYLLINNSKKLEASAKHALHSVTYILFLMGLVNCPFFGVGMGEFFFLLIAVLLKMKCDVDQDSKTVR